MKPTRIILPLLLVALALPVAAKKAPKDPVLMTVDSQPVYLSEFEYLYNKNKDQQVDQLSLPEYLEMFKVYKLKVAQARHEQVDTAAAFQKEFRGYRADLVAPYLRDDKAEQALIQEAYDHRKEQVEIKHLMLQLGHRALADSLREVLAANPERFDEITANYTTDPSYSHNKGYYSWVGAGQYPYEFESGVYNTPVGKVSDVIDTQFGHHIILALDRRKTPAEIHARHILVSFPAERSEEADAAAKARIDSIYTRLQAGEDFGELARKVSDCPSKAQGGELGWFGKGRMVPEFETVAFAIADDTFSAPFTTKFGWHIVNRLGTRDIEPLETLEPLIRQQMLRDGRVDIPRRAKIESILSEYGGGLNAQAVAYIDSIHKSNHYSPSATLTALTGNPMVLMQVGDSILTVEQLLIPMPRFDGSSIETMAQQRFDQVVLDYLDHRLESLHPELKNVVKEYYDGMMLFEVSNKNVWNVPTENPEGLEQYFRDHREKYSTWDAPRFKGYIIYATSDSLLNEVEAFLAANHPTGAQVGDQLKEAFPKNIKIERVVLPQGRNALVDHYGFGAEKPEPRQNARWSVSTVYLGHVIDQPEEASDARAAVSADYQAELEEKWVNELRQRYPIKVNNKVLKQVK